MDKIYQPEAIEKSWYERWEKNGYFAPQGKGESYCIMLPPPNVTGSLHMGHGFGFTLIDVLIRYERMRGKNTLWQTGTDHAGIATQMVVERKLNATNQSRHDLGREAFMEKVWEWKAESGNNITRQLRRLGASMDWERERFTMDENLSFAVREVFIQLYEEGLIYRGKRLVNWDPVLLTAISDLEVINQEEEGSLWHIRYPLVDGGFLTVATTRPETLLGDVAIAVHPDDARYQPLIGKMVKLPLTDRMIPVIADDYVDPAFGSGCVKITPAHDFNDYAIGMRHQLEPINILTPRATLNENTPLAYQNLDRFVARKQIIIDLQKADLIEKIDKHLLKIPRGDRSDAVIEPYLTHQWYVNSKALAEPAIAAVESGEVKFIPENWSKTYFQWMNNIEDWCISRQLWWGHRIPVWYDEKNQTYVGHNEADVRNRYQLPQDTVLRQDEDVLDTWFSSALWPFSSLGWPHHTLDLLTFFPTQVLITGFDIIFFWVARMIMMSLKFTGKVPFKEVYITGLIRDAEGHKMSKTKGNVLDPIDLIDGTTLDKLIEKRTYGLMQPAMAEKIARATRKEFPEGIPSYGTDALRFTFCSLASYTREIRFDVNRLGGYRNFCNKLWNAARYVLMQTEDKVIGTPISTALSLPDRYIREQLRRTTEAAHAALANYRYDLYAQALYEFTWNEFCDWYLEFSKPLLTEQTDQTLAANTRFILLQTLETLLRLLHPIMPYITEEIWQRIAPFAGVSGKTIMLASYPATSDFTIDEEAYIESEWLKKVIVAIRTLRSESNISPAVHIKIQFRKGTALDKKNFEHNQHLLTALAKVATFEWLAHDALIEDAATTVLSELEIYLPFEGLINKDEERTRLKKEIEKLKKDLALVEGKLLNPQFKERAPAAIVEKENNKAEEIKSTLSKLEHQLMKLK
ncbi:MAG: valine--tRNA ligase [Gammaproteobacteria bacterium]|nr:valine--tRNA ligase [Gammaproteobacteria bacterium]